MGCCCSKHLRSRWRQRKHNVTSNITSVPDADGDVDIVGDSDHHKALAGEVGGNGAGTANSIYGSTQSSDYALHSSHGTTASKRQTRGTKKQLIVHLDGHVDDDNNDPHHHHLDHIGGNASRAGYPSFREQSGMSIGGLSNGLHTDRSQSYRLDQNPTPAPAATPGAEAYRPGPNGVLLPSLKFDVMDIGAREMSEMSMMSIESVEISDDEFEEVRGGGGPESAAVSMGNISHRQQSSFSDANNATEMDQATINHLMSRIFTSTYHTQSLCLINAGTRSTEFLLSSKELSNSVVVSEDFCTHAFGKKSVTAPRLLSWLLGKDKDSPAAEVKRTKEPPPPRPKSEFVQNSPELSYDDKVFLADQQEILRRLLYKPRPKDVETNPEDRDDDVEVEDEAMAEQDLHQRTLEEGFCQVVLPYKDQGIPIIGTLYVSTIAAQRLPADLKSVIKAGVPLMTVVSVVATRRLDQGNHCPITNPHFRFPKSKNICREQEANTDVIANQMPTMVRGPYFTGNVFVKTVLAPVPDGRITPYFEGKNRVFEIQLQGRITPPAGVDVTRGTTSFIIYLPDGLQGPGGSKLSWSQKLMTSAIVKAFKVIGRGGLQVLKGDESAKAYPMMAIPLLTFVDRLIVRGGGTNGIPKKSSAPSALGVSMLPETGDAKKLKQQEKENKAAGHSNLNVFRARDYSYTISFHSQYLDFEGWCARKIPGIGEVNLHGFWGNQAPIVGIGHVPEGVSPSELREKGFFFVRLSVENESNAGASPKQ